MGELVTAAYTVSDGEEYVTYLTHLVAECERLRAEGRVPDTEAILVFFDDLRTAKRLVRQDVTAATSRGEQSVVTRMPMPAADYQRMNSMNDSVRGLLEILQLRKAVDLQRTAGSERVALAFREGTYQE